MVSALVFFALLHIALTAASELTRILRDPIYADKDLKLGRREGQVPQGTPLVVFIGTSRTANGFDSGRSQALLKEEFGREMLVFNWGIPGSGPVTHLMHLKRILASGRRPALLLLEFLPASVVQIPVGTIEGKLCEGMTLDWSELDWVGDYQFPVERLRRERAWAAIEPWYALRFKIVSRLDPTMLPFHLRYDWSRGPDANGWSPIMADEVGDEQRSEALARNREEYGNILTDVAFNEVAVGAFRDVLALARQYGIATVIVRMPEASIFRSFYSARGNDAFQKLLDDLATEFSVRVCDAREWSADEQFADGHHLLKKGAAPFSEKLTRAIISNCP